MRLGRVALSVFVALVMALLTTTASADANMGIDEPSEGPAKFAPGFVHGKVAVEGAPSITSAAGRARPLCSCTAGRRPG